MTDLYEPAAPTGDPSENRRAAHVDYTTLPVRHCDTCHTNQPTLTNTPALEDKSLVAETDGGL